MSDAQPPAADDDAAVLAARLASVRSRVAAACSDAGRPAADVRVLLATKTVDAARIRLALAADAAAVAADPALTPVLVGENRVQELVAKGPDLADLRPTTHLIGPLQSNKVNAALRWVSCVESVTSLDLARRLSDRCADRPVALDVLVQVNVSGEVTKHGVPLTAAADLALAVAALPGVRLAGFMTVGLRSPDVAAVGAGYASLAALRDEVLTSGAPGTQGARELSMGMSGDLEVAVAHGATLVRVGSAVFGDRPAR
ncbi:YggS family pyridoxal phosphate-dependent enzyme [Cellulomonas fimi]|uniref:Pyridoxal phosphate homeostasis protein n=1 Tax=Cellulomonas fimi (strain ATCC 484 / DSM 20113 / JCM 1341 / CCUG 24087 / LMG 16345 / NBRC 15513 / NCIMB 8980 / NCTC 7547 / NRS-133) TaxID=590998 RepID=F4H6Q2_CELFA|nr:YggS family pyridoxal phosphate-dependent enzyme [Cellulomonas fimi]AEE46813.1 alanine racemase domain protein [Cellulomonas fimi ATCC 484]NNH06356.1 YggS family pyridoxal phosphate-dependent enzyme [Cellulomonas fimi]VEH34262.1 Predicted enzyme with a TIM-barrel fold [Cellulomonas fimi]